MSSLSGRTTMNRLAFISNNVLLLLLVVNIMQPSICSDSPTNTRNCKLKSRHQYYLTIDSSGNVGSTKDPNSKDGKTRLLFLFFTNLVVLQCQIQYCRGFCYHWLKLFR